MLGWTMSRLLAIPVIGLLALGLPAQAQRLRDIPQVVEDIYEAMPQLPLENTYQTSEGETISSSSWLQRVLLYHIRTQGRLPDSYLDWKLTFADYQGVNVPMFASAYPGADQFTVNPLNRDRELFQSLGREERRQLLDMFLATYGMADLQNPLELSDVNSASLLGANGGGRDGTDVSGVSDGSGLTSSEDASSDETAIEVNVEGDVDLEGDTVQLDDSGPGSADLLRLD